MPFNLTRRNNDVTMERNSEQFSEPDQLQSRQPEAGLELSISVRILPNASRGLESGSSTESLNAAGLLGSTKGSDSTRGNALSTGKTMGDKWYSLRIPVKCNSERLMDDDRKLNKARLGLEKIEFAGSGRCPIR